MIKFENTEVFGWEAAIRGMRNPMNSWEKSDSYQKLDYNGDCDLCTDIDCQNSGYEGFVIGPNDLDLMTRLRNAGTDHRKFMRMITVYVDITAPLYWWKEFDTYKVGTVANSCSTMHKIAEKEFTLEDFSYEHLIDPFKRGFIGTLDDLNLARALYICKTDEERESLWRSYYGNAVPMCPTKKECWEQMIQLLPSSYNQRRTVMLNYEVLANIYKSRRNHKLDEWSEHADSTCTMDTVGRCENPKEFLLCEDCSIGKGFCDWIKTLPYSELITG